MSTTPQNQKTMPAQHQDQRPGIESEMHPRPEFEKPEYKAAGKLTGKVALITGVTAELDVLLLLRMPRKARISPLYT